jgi:DNA polymerase/3'-5' exonuclease PolX
VFHAETVLCFLPWFPYRPKFEGFKVACDGNRPMAEAFADLADAYRDTGEYFKSSVFKKVAGHVAEAPEPITSSKALKGIKGVGKSSLAKVDEFLTTGALAAIAQIREAAGAPVIPDAHANEALRFL